LNKEQEKKRNINPIIRPEGETPNSPTYPENNISSYLDDYKELFVHSENTID